jgi:hypothetical protein
MARQMVQAGLQAPHPATLARETLVLKVICADFSKALMKHKYAWVRGLSGGLWMKVPPAQFGRIVRSPGVANSLGVS